jgi:hypothetical protein
MANHVIFESSKSSVCPVIATQERALYRAASALGQATGARLTRRPPQPPRRRALRRSCARSLHAARCRFKCLPIDLQQPARPVSDGCEIGAVLFVRQRALADGAPGANIGVKLVFACPHIDVALKQEHEECTLTTTFVQDGFAADAITRLHLQNVLLHSA